MMDTATLSPGWQAFERLQHSLENKRRVDRQVLAEEEALTELAGTFASGDASEEEVGRRYHSLLLNRRRKHQFRGRLFDAFASESRRRLEEKVDNPMENAQRADQVTFVRRNVAPSEWAVLRGVASGADQASLAAIFGVSEGSLRVLLFRTRRRLRAAG